MKILISVDFSKRIDSDSVFDFDFDFDFNSTISLYPNSCMAHLGGAGGAFSKAFLAKRVASLAALD